MANAAAGKINLTGEKILQIEEVLDLDTIENLRKNMGRYYKSKFKRYLFNMSKSNERKGKTKIWLNYYIKDFMEL